jgi:RNA polymerase sigma factor (sigma-70 family)
MSAEGDEAIDVVQGLLVAVLERIEQGDALLPVEELSNDELQRYLIRAVRNYWLDRKRRDGIIQRNYEELFRALEVVPSTPESLLTDSQHREILRQSVAALHSPYRKLLEALLDDDVTLAELARRRKIRRGTVYTQFHRAIEALRAEWDRRTKIRRHRDPPLST